MRKLFILLSVLVALALSGTGMFVIDTLGVAQAKTFEPANDNGSGGGCVTYEDWQDRGSYWHVTTYVCTSTGLQVREADVPKYFRAFQVNINPANEGGGGSPWMECIWGRWHVWNGSYWAVVGAAC